MTQIWLAVDENGCEYIYKAPPVRAKHGWYPDSKNSKTMVKLPRGSIEKLIGRVLTWSDDAVMVEG